MANRTLSPGKRRRCTRTTLPFLVYPAKFTRVLTENTSGFWLVPHALELCHAGAPLANATKHSRISRDYSPWLPQHPRFVLLFLPTDYPRANPIERYFGNRHDKVTATIDANAGGIWSPM